MKKLVGWYRHFKHRIYNIPGYYKKVMIPLLTLFIIDMILLGVVW